MGFNMGFLTHHRGDPLQVFYFMTSKMKNSKGSPLWKLENPMINPIRKWPFRISKKKFFEIFLCRSWGPCSRTVLGRVHTHGVL